LQLTNATAADRGGDESANEPAISSTAASHTHKRSFIRLTLVDDNVRRDPDLYLYSEEDRLERETKLQLVFLWIPERRHRIYVGMDAIQVDNDNLPEAKLEEKLFYAKYSRRFRF
jgi:hypothetical protein